VDTRAFGLLNIGEWKCSRTPTVSCARAQINSAKLYISKRSVLVKRESNDSYSMCKSVIRGSTTIAAAETTEAYRELATSLTSSNGLPPPPPEVTAFICGWIIIDWGVRARAGRVVPAAESLSSTGEGLPSGCLSILKLGRLAVVTSAVPLMDRREWCPGLF